MSTDARDIWAPGKKIGPKTYVKASDFKRFWDHGWSEDFWHDDADVEFYDDEGKWSLPFDAVVRLDRLGYACWQGDNSRKMGEMEPVWEHFRDWVLGAQPLMAVAIALPKDALPELKALLDRHAGRFIGDEPDMPESSPHVDAQGTDLEARLKAAVAAMGQARLALSGMVSAESAINQLDEVLGNEHDLKAQDTPAPGM